ITGKISNKWKKDNAGKNMSALEDALTDTLEEIFRLQIEIVSEHYSGENFGNSIINRLTYHSKDGKYVQLFFDFEESLVLQVVSSMLGMHLKKMDKLVINAVRELSQQIADQVAIHLHLPSQYQLESNHVMTADQFQQEFSTKYFDYNLLFNTGTGYFAFCIQLE
ncbi:MAG: hypothetical protein K2G39_11830, partial [Lachnospiraceae bacterium]|nr:hypothetical protein [Lachnospiraceae bacterium]